MIGQLWHKKPSQKYHTHIYSALSGSYTPLTNTPNTKTNAFANVLCLLALSNNDYKRDLLQVEKYNGKYLVSNYILVFSKKELKHQIKIKWTCFSDILRKMLELREYYLEVWEIISQLLPNIFTISWIVTTAHLLKIFPNKDHWNYFFHRILKSSTLLKMKW